jgi:hypothetical protein
VRGGLELTVERGGEKLVERFGFEGERFVGRAHGLR